MRAHVNRMGLGPVSTWLTACLALAAIAGGTAINLAARQNAPSALDMANKGKVTVQVVGATPGLTIELALNGGKIADTPIATDGTGNSVLDVANLGKTQAQVWIQRCENGKRVRVLIYTSGGPPDDKDCDRKPLGFFWTDRATRIVINVRSSSMSVTSAGGLTTNKLLIIGGGAAAVTTGIVAAGGSSSSGSTAPTATVPVVTTPTNNPVATPAPAPAPTTPTPTTPTPATPPYAFLVNRTYNNLVTRGRAECAGFSPSAPTQLRLSNIDPQTGMGSFVHIHSGTTTLNYTVQSAQKTGDTNATLIGTGTVAFGTTTYQLRITVNITGNTDSKTEEFSCGSNLMTVYTGSGSVAP